jgi:ketosteroid isomerase-like protein
MLHHKLLFGVRRMRVNSHLFLILLIGSALSAPAQTPKFDIPQEEERLLALERMWNQAQVQRDSAALATMIGDKFVSTEYDGEVSDRGKFLADIADPKLELTEMNIKDVKVIIFGEAAVVTGTYRTKGTYNSKAYQHVGRFTDTWVFSGGKWECMASHSSLIKQ